MQLIDLSQVPEGRRPISIWLQITKDLSTRNQKRPAYRPANTHDAAISQTTSWEIWDKFQARKSKREKTSMRGISKLLKPSKRNNCNNEPKVWNFQKWAVRTSTTIKDSLVNSIRTKPASTVCRMEMRVMSRDCRKWMSNWNKRRMKEREEGAGRRKRLMAAVDF